MLFAEEAKKLKQKYGSKWADDPKIAARFVEYGNHTVSQLKKLAKIGTLGPAALPWLIYHQVGNMIDNHKRIKGTYLKNEVGDVRKFYATDPNKNKAVERAKTDGASGAGNKTDSTLGKNNHSDSKLFSNPFKVGAKNKVAVEPQPPKKGPTAALIHNEELIASQRNRIINYNNLRTAALNSAGQKPSGPPKKRGVGKAVLRKKKFSVVPVRS